MFIGVNVVMWVSLLVASQKDPGFLPRNTDEYHRAIKQIAYYDEWKSHKGEEKFNYLIGTSRILCINI